VAELACPRCAPRAAGAYRAASVDALKRQPLEPTTWESDIEVLCCKRCDGVWLAEGQLDAIRHTRGNDYSKVDKLAAAAGRARRAAVSPDAKPERELDCPTCDEPMVGNTYRSSQVSLQTCMRCAGSWVDGADLAQIEIHEES
jgi:Zn-finger nucleic acid-binding protein